MSILLGPDPVVASGCDPAGPRSAVGSALHAVMTALARAMGGGPHDSPRRPRTAGPGAVRVGVDLGTAYTVIVVLDGAGVTPLGIALSAPAHPVSG